MRENLFDEFIFWLLIGAVAGALGALVGSAVGFLALLSWVTRDLADELAYMTCVFPLVALVAVGPLAGILTGLVSNVYRKRAKLALDVGIPRVVAAVGALLAGLVSGILVDVWLITQ